MANNKNKNTAKTVKQDDFKLTLDGVLMGLFVRLPYHCILLPIGKFFQFIWWGLYEPPKYSTYKFVGFRMLIAGLFFWWVAYHGDHYAHVKQIKEFLGPFTFIYYIFSLSQCLWLVLNIIFLGTCPHDPKTAKYETPVTLTPKQLFELKQKLKDMRKYAPPLSDNLAEANSSGFEAIDEALEFRDGMARQESTQGKMKEYAKTGYMTRASVKAGCQESPEFNEAMEFLNGMLRQESTRGKYEYLKGLFGNK
jgi:hypothetical protein